MDEERWTHLLTNPRKSQVVVFQFILISMSILSIKKCEGLHGRDNVLNRSIVKWMGFIDEEAKHLNAMTLFIIIMLSRH
jgi:hypothetical protein